MIGSFSRREVLCLAGAGAMGRAGGSPPAPQQPHSNIDRHLPWMGPVTPDPGFGRGRGRGVRSRPHLDIAAGSAAD
jgi:hypothetical protein